MEASRDLGNVDPWQESLERSLARRGKPAGTGRPASDAPAAARPPAHDRPVRTRTRRGAAVRARTRRGAAVRVRTRRGAGDRPARARTGIRWDRLLTAGSGGLLAIVFLVVVTAGGVAGRGAQASVDSSRATAYHDPARGRSGSRAPAATFTPIRMPGAGRCQPVGAGSGYVNPLAGDVLRGERIDQGVDYAGTGTLRALGLAKVTYVGTAETGWPGAFIEFRLLSGPDAGCFVYYAEGINPVPSLHAGQKIRPGQRLADIIPGWSTGIELGWGAGASTKTYAARVGRWSPTDDANNVATASGRSFSALIAALGGPAGKVEG